MIHNSKLHINAEGHPALKKTFLAFRGTGTSIPMTRSMLNMLNFSLLLSRLRTDPHNQAFKKKLWKLTQITEALKGESKRQGSVIGDRMIPNEMYHCQNCHFAVVFRMVLRWYSPTFP